MNPPVKILGLDFFSGSTEEAILEILTGGLLVAPAAPGLAHNLNHDPIYRAALLNAKVCLPDSGLMVLVWNKIQSSKGNRIRRISGLEFLEKFLLSPFAAEFLTSSFWIMPDRKETELNLRWIKYHTGVEVTEESTYIAPKYPKSGKIADDLLVEKIAKKKPNLIVINVGGGIQERLGDYLQNNLETKSAILCCGAAIAFLAGGQTSIPAWADELKLGWLLRCISNPSMYVPRYWHAKTIIPLLLKHRHMLPPMLGQ